MAETDGERIEVKTLKTTDLDPSALTKAIEDSAKAQSKPAKVSVKAESSKPVYKAPAVQDKSADEPTQIIVKKKSSYVTSGGQSPPVKPTDQPESEKSQPALKPPSATAKVFQPPQPATDVDAGDKEPAQPAAAAEDKASTPTSEPSPEQQTATSIDKQVKKLNEQKKTEPEPQQALKVFDTTQYHLPIKPTAGKHYMNTLGAWVILTLFVAAISGYMLNELEVIDLSPLGL